MRTETAIVSTAPLSTFLSLLSFHSTFEDLTYVFFVPWKEILVSLTNSSVFPGQTNMACPVSSIQPKRDARPRASGSFSVPSGSNSFHETLKG